MLTDSSMRTSFLTGLKPQRQLQSLFPGARMSGMKNCSERCFYSTEAFPQNH